MTIDRISPLEPFQPGKKSGRSGQVEKGKNTDSISLSSEAVAKSELYQAMELVSSADEVRAERIAQLKAKINDPSYLNDKVIQATAEKILESLGL
ncbi:MAG: flagellar biosynthesis anti-sigma factor FlgM [Treponema sp.]|nr:flagellar biosynthesis anti-sigma factor FlgM [Treponema sp.]